MIGFDDFRASLHAGTAARRLDWFGSLLATLKAEDELRLVDAGPQGSASAWYSPRYQLRRLLEAQVAFARAQLDAAAAAVDAAAPAAAVEPAEDVAMPDQKLTDLRITCLDIAVNHSVYGRSDEERLDFAAAIERYILSDRESPDA